MKLKVILRFFKCMESMARDMRHPYIPSTTVLGDILVSFCRCDYVMFISYILMYTLGCAFTIHKRSWCNVLYPPLTSCLLY